VAPYSAHAFVREADSLSLLQRSAQVTPENRQKTLALLLSKAKELKSAAIYALAMRIEGDPFAKVKQLIKDLITRLLEEANAEVTHKGWCDTNVAENTKKRDFAQEAVDKLAARVEESSARQLQLVAGVASLEGEIQALQTAFAEASALRQADHDAAVTALKEAKEAAAAVGQAMGILRDFYKTAAKGAAFVQLRVAAAQEPFNGKYAGQQGAGESILGLLEVIRDQFLATHQQVDTNEARAEREFVVYKRETDASVAGKNATIRNYREEIEELTADIAQDTTDLNTNKALLDAALVELEKLRLACTDQGMSWEERSKRRKEEVQALQTAYAYLGGEAPTTWGDLGAFPSEAPASLVAKRSLRSLAK
jgi:predicted  nucleic acid-binding Zn-ribbon protein